MRHFLLNGEIIGFIGYKKYRRKGIGKKLLEEVLKRNEGKIVFTYTDTESTWKFWEKVKFYAAVTNIQVKPPFEEEETTIIWIFNKPVEEEKFKETLSYYCNKEINEEEEIRKFKETLEEAKLIGWTLRYSEVIGKK